MKICNKCSIEKELLEFPKTGKVCKLCKSEYSKKYKEENSEKLKEAHYFYPYLI